MRTPSHALRLSLAMLALAASTGCEEPVIREPQEEPPIELPGPAPVPSSAPSCPSIGTSERRVGRFYELSMGSDRCAAVKVCVQPDAWRSLPEVSYIPGIDLVILFDVTGSMGPYINAMVANIQQLIVNLEGLTPSLRLGLVSYQDFGDRGGDRGDRPFRLVVPLTADGALLRTELGLLHAEGGGDTPESLSTALKAAVDGEGLNPYFGPSAMGWSDDPTRIKVVLAVTDASDRRERLPEGAPTLAQAAALLKEKGVLFLGIGRKAKTHGSFDDLSLLARESGAIVRAPGIDLDGDGLATRDGEVKAGEPAVLQMSSTGKLLGAPDTSNPTRVLADAITLLVRRTKPFIFQLGVVPGGRGYAPESNTLVVPPAHASELCFSEMRVDSLAVAAGACPSVAPVILTAAEEMTATDVHADLLRTQVRLGCGLLPGGGGQGPQPMPTATPSPTPTPTRLPGDSGDEVQN